MNGLGRLRTALDVVDGPPDRGLGQSSGNDQCGHLSTGKSSGAGSHTPLMVSVSDTKSRDRRLVFRSGNRDSGRMNENWPEQEVFCLRVREFAERGGHVTKRGALDLPVLAELFDVAENSLKQFLQNKKRPRPHYDTLSKIASVIGSGVLEFMGTDGPVPGTQPDVDMAFGNIMGILGKNLDEATKKAMIEMAKAAQQKGKERRSRKN